MENIFLTQKEFDDLPEYSCTNPTGTTIGKKWKMGRPYMEPRQAWYLCEYCKDPDPKMVQIKYKRLYVEGSDDPALRLRADWPHAEPMPVELL